MEGSYSFLPEVRRAERRTDEAERAAEGLVQALERALVALAKHDLRAAQAIRGETFERIQGVMPAVAGRLHRLPLAHYAEQAAVPPEAGSAGRDD